MLAGMRIRRLTDASPTAGDAGLAELFLGALPLDRSVYAACLAVVGPEGFSVTTIGCDLHDTFHIGSVSKALNGLIYTDMVNSGLISPHDQLDRYLPLAGTAAGTVTLESCLTHTSGLPSIGGGVRSTARALVGALNGRDPQPDSLDDLMAQLRRSRLQDAGQFRYSNLAASALGHALAAADGVDYPTLVCSRLAEPLGCSNLRVQRPGERNLPQDVRARTVWGTEQHPWTGQGYAPAGAIRAGAQDFAAILTALLDEGSAYRDAFRVRFTDDTDVVAAGWFIEHDGGRTLAWHNGYASGFGAHMVLDLERRRGAFISVMTPWPDVDIEPIALKMLETVA